MQRITHPLMIYTHQSSTASTRSSGLVLLMSMALLDRSRPRWSSTHNPLMP